MPTLPAESSLLHYCFLIGSFKSKACPDDRLWLFWGMNVDIPTPLIDEPVRPLILVGNGAYDTAVLAKFAPLGPVVAVDGGYYGCRIAGITPDLLIGDMDSVAAEDLIDARTRMRVHPLAEQDSTDLEKALRHIRAPAILGFGFLGKRLDHSLAALSVLARYAHQHRVILVGSEDVLHITSGRFKMAMKTGDRLSVWPIGRVDFVQLYWFALAAGRAFDGTR